MAIAAAALQTLARAEPVSVSRVDVHTGTDGAKSNNIVFAGDWFMDIFSVFRDAREKEPARLGDPVVEQINDADPRVRGRRLRAGEGRRAVCH